jgi:hypothetical protein
VSYEDFIWHIGVNGRTYRLSERNGPKNPFVLATADGSVTIIINQGRKLTSNGNPNMPIETWRVRISIETRQGRSTVPAFQLCRDE